MSRPIKSEKITIPGPKGDLEAVIEYPDESIERSAIAICCHPHPQHGGAMTNKVIYTVARAQVALGIPAIRFNFRGVGKSAGEYDEGRGEALDLEAVITWVGDQFPDRAIWLSGFSFGSWISSLVAQKRQPDQLISIAPPVERGGFTDIKSPACPWLIVMGDADEVVSFSATENWVKNLTPTPDWCVMKGAGHFFHSRLVELRELLETRLLSRAQTVSLVESDT